jgi:hypothetical protein
MALPSAAELQAIFAAAREYGVTHLRVGPLEVRFAGPAAQPVPVAFDGAAMVDAINAGAPLPGQDPLDTIREGGLDSQRRMVRDPLETLSRGGRLLDDGPADPTQRV